MKDISEYSVLELKALGYDSLARIEAFQRDLATVNAELEKRSKEGKEEVVQQEVTEVKEEVVNG